MQDPSGSGRAEERIRRVALDSRQGGTQADLRQAPDRKREMYYSVRFLDNIGNIELKSILSIKNLKL